MLAGLLHDIGYWVLAQECPGRPDQATELAAAEGIPLHQAETQVIGASHAEIGAYLLGIWGLPSRHRSRRAPPPAAASGADRSSTFWRPWRSPVRSWRATTPALSVRA